MKIPVFTCIRRFPTITKTAPVLIAALMLFCFAGVAVGASGGSSGEEHATEAKGWVATDTYKVMNFAVLAIALVFLLRKPMKKALNDRIQGIQDQLSELEAKKKAAEDELANYNRKFQQLDQESEKLIAQYIQQGEEAKVRIIKEAENAAEKLQVQARRNIEQEFKRAKLNLQEEVLEKALAQAEELIRNKISDDDQERLVDEYLEKVVA
jgi:F-type H+-transporting ATPase subunit b